MGLNGRRASCAFSQLSTTGREGALKRPEGLGVTRGGQWGATEGSGAQKVTRDRAVPGAGGPGVVPGAW